MSLETIENLVRDALGGSASVKTRRPRLFQVGVPAYMADGDGASVFVREHDDGRLAVSDMGRTLMRLSYTRDITDRVEEDLSRLAAVHGFALVDGELVATIGPREIAAGVLGLVQVESEAESSIQIASSRREQATAFRVTVREALKEIFAERCHLNFSDPVVDPEGDYAIDAVIDGANTLGVFVVANDFEVDRALVHKAKLDPVLLRRNPRRYWVAVPRDVGELSPRSRRKLDPEYITASPERAHLEERLVGLSR